MKFFFKLIKHGGIFLVRVIGIVFPAVAQAFSEGRGVTTSESNEWHGIPNLDAIEHPMWEETYGTNRKPW